MAYHSTSGKHSVFADPGVGLLAFKDVPSGSVALKIIGKLNYWKDVRSARASHVDRGVLQHRDPTVRHACYAWCGCEKEKPQEDSGISRSMSQNLSGVWKNNNVVCLGKPDRV